MAAQAATSLIAPGERATAHLLSGSFVPLVYGFELCDAHAHLRTAAISE